MFWACCLQHVTLHIDWLSTFSIIVWFCAYIVCSFDYMQRLRWTWKSLTFLRDYHIVSFLTTFVACNIYSSTFLIQLMFTFPASITNSTFWLEISISIWFAVWRQCSRSMESTRSLLLWRGKGVTFAFPFLIISDVIDSRFWVWHLW